MFGAQNFIKCAEAYDDTTNSTKDRAGVSKRNELMNVTLDGSTFPYRSTVINSRKSVKFPKSCPRYMKKTMSLVENIRPFWDVFFLIKKLEYKKLMDIFRFMSWYIIIDFIWPLFQQKKLPRGWSTPSLIFRTTNSTSV